MVAGNWKMNLQPAEAAKLVREVAEAASMPEYEEVETVVCPPALYLPLALNNWQRGHNLPIGAQNCHWESSGAYTGEVSPEMLHSIGVTYVIIGHSERRSYFGETDASVSKKVQAALGSELRAIVCCGETLEERKADRHREVVERQIKAALNGLTQSDMKKVIIAYEPVWAIGTGETATSEQAQEMHAFIRETLSNLFDDATANDMSILYGGSCKPGNAAELFAQPDVDGGLIGGASLVAEDFLAIARSF